MSHSYARNEHGIWCVLCGKTEETAPLRCTGNFKPTASASVVSRTSGETEDEHSNAAGKRTIKSQDNDKIVAYATINELKQGQIDFTYIFRAVESSRWRNAGIGRDTQFIIRPLEYLRDIKQSLSWGITLSTEEKEKWATTSRLSLHLNSRVLTNTEKFGALCRGDWSINTPERLDIRDFFGSGDEITFPTDPSNLTAMQTATPLFRLALRQDLRDYEDIMVAFTGCPAYTGVTTTVTTFLTSMEAAISPNALLWYLVQRAMASATKEIKESSDPVFTPLETRPTHAAAVVKRHLDSIEFDKINESAYKSLLMVSWPDICFAQTQPNSNKRKAGPAIENTPSKSDELESTTSSVTRSGSKTLIKQTCLAFMANQLGLTRIPAGSTKPTPMTCETPECRFNHDLLKQNWTQEEVIQHLKTVQHPRSVIAKLREAVGKKTYASKFK
jgi:hypothetical protein